MPKTTKNKTNLFSKLNLSSTKARLVVVVLGFAIIGGGYTVYKSFAATASLAFTVSNGSLKATPPSSTTSSEADPNDPKGKSAVSILVITPNGTASVDGNPQISIAASQKFQMCIDAKSTANLSGDGSVTALVPSGLTINTNVTKTPLANGYSQYCSDTVSWPRQLSGPITLDNGSMKPGTAYISQFTIKLVN